MKETALHSWPIAVSSLVPIITLMNFRGLSSGPTDSSEEVSCWAGPSPAPGIPCRWVAIAMSSCAVRCRAGSYREVHKLKCQDKFIVFPQALSSVNNVGVRLGREPITFPQLHSFLIYKAYPDFRNVKICLHTSEISYYSCLRWKRNMTRFLKIFMIKIWNWVLKKKKTEDKRRKKYLQHINKGLVSRELGDAPNQLAKGKQQKNGKRDEGGVHRSEISNHNDHVERSSTSLVNGINAN